jgi:hypothetical protein
LGNATAIISILAVLVNAVAALVWGTKTIEAKNSEIQSLKTALDNLGKAHDAGVAALQSDLAGHKSQITHLTALSDRQLKAAQDDRAQTKETYENLLREKDVSLKAKDDLTEELHSQIVQLRAELKDLKPTFWIEEYKKIKTEQEQLIAEMRQNLDRANAGIKAREEKINQLETEGGQHSAEIERLRVEITQIRAKAENLEQKAQYTPDLSQVKVEVIPEKDVIHRGGADGKTKAIIYTGIDHEYTRPQDTPFIYIGDSHESIPLSNPYQQIVNLGLWNEFVKTDLSELTDMLALTDSEKTKDEGEI